MIFCLREFQNDGPLLADLTLKCELSWELLLDKKKIKKIKKRN
jgi:hypothetical protein